MNQSNLERFSDRVENYVKYRPGYPTEIIRFLNDYTHFSRNSIIADIGSGTGLSAELFLKNGNKVYGVEPNQEMRKAGERELKSYALFESVDGTAENTTLQTNSVDFVVAGQAFHWFDQKKAKKEFRRILKENGLVLLIWNERNNESSFLKEYDQFLVEHSIDYTEIDHRNIDERSLSAFYGKDGYKLQVFSKEQIFDLAGLRGRYLSCSYAYNEGHPAFPKANKALEGLFNKFQKGGKLKMEYETKVYYGAIS